MIEQDSLVGAPDQGNEDIVMKSVRPDSFPEYIGQDDVKSQMALFIEAAKKARRCTGSFTDLRSSGFRKDYIGSCDCPSNGRRFKANSRSSIRALW